MIHKLVCLRGAQGDSPLPVGHMAKAWIGLSAHLDVCPQEKRREPGIPTEAAQAVIQEPSFKFSGEEAGKTSQLVERLTCKYQDHVQPPIPV